METIERKIVDFFQDEEGHWVALLACAHTQHVRHTPPFIERPWTLTPQGRDEKRGALLPCPLCLRMEFPDRVKAYKRTKTFDQDTCPAGLRAAHTTKAGVWAQIHILEGQLQYEVHDPITKTFTLDPQHHGIVVPQIPHQLVITEGVSFYVEFYKS